MCLFLKELENIYPSTWGLRCIHVPCRAVIELRLWYECGWYIMKISNSKLKFVVPCRRFESAWVIVSNPKSCVYCSRISKGTRVVEIVHEDCFFMYTVWFPRERKAALATRRIDMATGASLWLFSEKWKASTDLFYGSNGIRNVQGIFFVFNNNVFEKLRSV